MLARILGAVSPTLLLRGLFCHRFLRSYRKQTGRSSRPALASVTASSLFTMGEKQRAPQGLAKLERAEMHSGSPATSKASSKGASDMGCFKSATG